MFDDLTPKNVPAGQPGGFAPKPPVVGNVEDMFSAAEPEKPAAFQPKPTSNFQNVVPVAPGNGGGNMVKKILVFSLIIVGLGFVGGGAYYAYGKFYKKMEDAPVTTAEPTKTETPVSDEVRQVEQVNNANLENAAAQGGDSGLDTDQDGLTDKEEEALGTNKSETDSDFDGLFDREEVKVYGTNPLNPDTDGDGVKDGDEVANKTNPKGDGALYSVENSLSSSTSAENPASSATPSTREQTASATPASASVTTTEASQATQQSSTVDTDGDGLSDADETNVYKTDPNKADTDSDGLSDSEEVNKYKTNPLVADTDGDTYLDGAEVQKGYNPNGAGKLTQ